ATVTLVNSTLSDNKADIDGGAIYQTAAGVNSVTIVNGTVAGNQSNRAGGFDNTAGGISVIRGSVTLHNTIAALHPHRVPTPPPTDVPDDIRGALDPSSSFNLIGDGSNMTGVTNGVNGNQVGSAGSAIDPKLGPLGNNGGPTQTRALLAG